MCVWADVRFSRELPFTSLIVTITTASEAQAVGLWSRERLAIPTRICASTFALNTRCTEIGRRRE